MRPIIPIALLFLPYELSFPLKKTKPPSANIGGFIELAYKQS
jgi:hypothetical protein